MQQKHKTAKWFPQKVKKKKKKPDGNIIVPSSLITFAGCNFLSFLLFAVDVFSLGHKRSPVGAKRKLPELFQDHSW